MRSRSRSSLGDPLQTSQLWFGTFFLGNIVFKIFKFYLNIDLEVNVKVMHKISTSSIRRLENSFETTFNFQEFKKVFPSWPNKKKQVHSFCGVFINQFTAWQNRTRSKQFYLTKICWIKVVFINMWIWWITRSLFLKVSIPVTYTVSQK